MRVVNAFESCKTAALSFCSDINGTCISMQDSLEARAEHKAICLKMVGQFADRLGGGRSVSRWSRRKVAGRMLQRQGYRTKVKAKCPARNRTPSRPAYSVVKKSDVLTSPGP